MKIIYFILVIQFFLFLNSCRDSGTGNDIAPYDGEGFSQHITWQNFNIPDTMIFDSNYKTKTRIKSKYKLIGDIYLMELDENLVFDLVSEGELVKEPNWSKKEKFKIRLNTNNENNIFDFETEVLIKNDYWNDKIDGHLFSIYIQIDSIFIDSDTLYRTSFGDDSLNYPFLTQGKRWFVRGQKMYDSTHSQETTDLEFLSQYFSDQIFQVFYYQNQLLDKTIYLKRGEK